MKFIRLVAMLFLTTFLAEGQSFEGKVVYQNDYKSKLPNVTNEQLNDMMGTVMEYHIKNGVYKSVLNGSFLKWQLYQDKDNRLYTRMANSEAVLWNDAAVTPDKVLKVEVNKGVETVLGYLCDEIILTCTSGVQRYYFSSKLKVDADLYKKHKYGNWSDYLSMARALPLKSIVDAQQFTLVSVATEVTPMKLDDSFFQLPENVALEKSPY